MSLLRSGVHGAGPVPTAPAAPAAYTPDVALVSGEAGPGGASAPDATADGVPTEVRIVDIGPKVVSPAWELELLISGAVTFGLLQLPPLIRDTQLALLARVSGNMQAVVFVGGMYARALVYALIATFLLNLVARAYWVGLVGLQSVYPAGPRWEAYTSGPFLRDEYRRRLPSLTKVTARVDDFASVLFSFGFLIALVVGLSSAAAAVLGGVAYVVSRTVPGAPAAGVLLNCLFAALFVPTILVGVLDKYLGPRLDPGGRWAAGMRRAVRYTYAPSAAPLFGAVFVTLFTNIKGPRFYALFYGAFVGAFGLASANALSESGAFDPGVAVYVPRDPDLRGVHAVHYESMRRGDLPPDVPTIQSDVVTDPYLRLFVPYDPDRVDAALPRLCPGVAQLRPRGFALRRRRRAAADTSGDARRADAVLACLTRAFAVSVDGTPVADLRLRFGEHAAGGTPGFVARLPLAALPSGEHVLRLTPLPRPADAGGPATPAEPLEIPFWK